MTLKSTRNLIISSALRKHLVTFFCLLVIARVAIAQDSVSTKTQGTGVQENQGRSLDLGTNQLGFWAGYSWDNPTLVGRTTNRPFSEYVLQYARVLISKDNWALKYTAEIVPAVFIKQPQQGSVNGHPVDLSGSRQTIYGAGFTPAGLQLNFRRGCVLQPYVNASAGVLYFEDQVPVADSSKFNFELGAGAGVEIWYRENQSIRLGYKYHHISNGYTARENPGVDSDLFYVGYAWSWKQ